MALPDRAGAGVGRGRVRAGPRAGRRARALREVAGRALDAGLPGPAASRQRRRRRAARAPHARGRASRRVTPEHTRHYTLEEASALLPRVAELLAAMRRARDRLGDAEARAA